MAESTENQPETKPRDATESDVIVKQVSLYMDVYKHHFDLFVKGTVVYLAVVGTVAGFVFKEGTKPPFQIALCIFVMLISFVGVYGCYASDKWVHDLEHSVRKMIEILNVEHFPFSGSRRIVRMVMLMCMLLCALAGLVAATIYMLPG